MCIREIAYFSSQTENPTMSDRVSRKVSQTLVNTVNAFFFVLLKCFHTHQSIVIEKVVYSFGLPHSYII